MTTKLRPSCADSVTATIAGPRGQKRGWETTTAQHAGFVNVSLGSKPCALGGSGFPPTLLVSGTSLWRSLSQHSLDEV